MSDDARMKKAREICRAHGLICLVPRPGVGGISCHEKTLCDCEVEKLIAEAVPKMPNKMEIEAAEILAYNGEIETGFMGGVHWLAKELDLGGGT